MDLQGHTPFISIIIPVFNMAGEVRRCLHSVIGQMTDEMEVLVVDDGSTDDTYKVVREYSENDPRIHIIRHQNAGVSSARNAGIDISRGDYLLFIDADDDIEDGYLQSILHQAKNSKADLLIWGIKRCYPSGHTEEWKPQMIGVYNRTDFLKAFPSEHCGNHNGLYGYVSNKLIKKKLVNCFGIRFNTALNIMEDYDFFLECYAHSGTVHCLGETGYRYHIYDKSDASSGYKIVSYPQLIGVQNKCVDILRKEGAWTNENKTLLFGVIGRLSLSLFMETTTPVWTRVKSNMDYIWKSPHCITAIESIDTRWKLLRRLILTRNVTGACIYIRIWRFYLSIMKAVVT
jgi:glycosyltransferase involved in cell wall biosynthesis